MPNITVRLLAIKWLETEFQLFECVSGNEQAPSRLALRCPIRLQAFPHRENHG